MKLSKPYACLFSGLFLCFFLLNAAASSTALWREEKTQKGLHIFIDAQMDIPEDRRYGIWDIAPGVVSEVEAQRISNVLFRRNNSPLQHFAPAKDFESADKALSLSILKYALAQDNQTQNVEVLNFYNYARSGTTATSRIYYSCEARSNGADFSSSLLRTEVDTLRGYEKSIETIINETAATIRQIAPGFDLFSMGTLSREATTDSERKNPESIPKMIGLVYTRKVKDLPILYQYNEDTAPSLVFAGLTQPSEYIKVMVGDKGIAEMVFEGYLAVGSELQSNVALLTSKEIQQIAKDELGKWIWRHYGKDAAGELHINSVRLGYYIQNAEDNSGRSILIPAWNFYGNFGKMHGQRDNAAQSVCFLSLNAVTGEVLK